MGNMEKQLKVQQLVDNLAKAIVGKDEAIQLVLVALFSGGHALLEDVPGVGKTLLAKSLAASISGKFQRVQCTPDLLPTDITGTNIWNPQKGEFQFLLRQYLQMCCWLMKLIGRLHELSLHC